MIWCRCWCWFVDDCDLVCSEIATFSCRAFVFTRGPAAALKLIQEENLFFDDDPRIYNFTHTLYFFCLISGEQQRLSRIERNISFIFLLSSAQLHFTLFQKGWKIHFVFVLAWKPLLGPPRTTSLLPSIATFAMNFTRYRSYSSTFRLSMAATCGIARNYHEKRA